MIYVRHLWCGTSTPTEVSFCVREKNRHHTNDTQKDTTQKDTMSHPDTPPHTQTDTDRHQPTTPHSPQTRYKPHIASLPLYPIHSTLQPQNRLYDPLYHLIALYDPIPYTRHPPTDTHRHPQTPLKALFIAFYSPFYDFMKKCLHYDITCDKIALSVSDRHRHRHHKSSTKRTLKTL